MPSTKNIFIVDDDADDREIFMEALAEISPSIKCTVAKDGSEALELLTRNSNGLPDVIFLDLNMPRMNGQECLIKIKKTKELSHIPVVIYTTSNSIHDVTRMKSLGATSFITKPTDFKILVNTLKSFVS